MNISTLLYYVDHGKLASPCFAHQFNWTSAQVRSLFNSLYRGFPTGSLILWVPDGAATRVQAGINYDSTAEVVVDGQQRIAAIYSVMRGKAPGFLNAAQMPPFPLGFDIVNQAVGAWEQSMEGDPHWIDLAKLFSGDDGDLGWIFDGVYWSSTSPERMGVYFDRLRRLRAILDHNIHVDYLPGSARLDEAIEVYVAANDRGGRSRRETITAEGPL